MSAPLSHTAKLKVAVPVAYLIAAFIFFALATFLIDFRISQVIGALITFISCILWIIARVQLGDAPAEARLVTTGLYGEFRHPIYLFSTTAFMGGTIFVWIKELVIVLVVLAIFQIIRSRIEEKALAQKLGRRYLRYKERTLF